MTGEISACGESFPWKISHKTILSENSSFLFRGKFELKTFTFLWEKFIHFSNVLESFSEITFATARRFASSRA
jgi:hypothetical protein